MDENDKKICEAMKNMREMMLTAKPSELNFKPDREFGSVYGILMEFHIDEHVATVVSMKDGTTSLYTTSQFGIIGSGEYNNPKKASKNFVRKASRYINKAVLVKVFPYPPKDEVHFYLLTFEGVKLINAKLNELVEEKDQNSDLFYAGQEVLTKIRLQVDYLEKKRGAANSRGKK
jgi:hypothetical protein